MDWHWYMTSGAVVGLLWLVDRRLEQLVRLNKQLVGLGARCSRRLEEPR
jgi:hypothetical protein